MKLTQETLIKQRFWFLLPLAFVLIFLAMGSVWSISNEAQQMATEVQKKYDELQKMPIQVTDKLLEVLRREREKAMELRWRLWTDMFNLQNDVVMEDGQPIIRRYLIRWPEHEAFKQFLTRDFGEPFGREEFPHELFRTHFPRLYDELLSILPLYDEKTGRGAVRVAAVAVPGRAGGGRDFGPGAVNPGAAAAASTRDLMLALLEPISFGEGTITNDEIWYALEDVAVRRLLLEALREVLDNFAVLKPEFVPFGEAEHGSATPEPEKKPPLGKPGPASPAGPKPGAIGSPAGPSGSAPPAEGKPAAQPKPAPTDSTPAEKVSPTGEPVKSKPAENKAATPPQSPPSADKTTTPRPQATPDKTPPRTLITRQRFYNRVWYYGVLGELNEAAANQPLPILGEDEGWLLDVRVTAELDEAHKPKQYYLEITSQNFSPRFDIPATPLRVWLETTTGRRFAVEVADAGSVPAQKDKNALKPSSTRPGAVPVVTQPTQRQLEPIAISLPPAPPAEGKDTSPEEIDVILGVQRVPTKELLEKGVLDYQRLANPHWIVDVMVRRSPSGVGFDLIGQIYNRSGRRQIPPLFEVVLSDGTNETRREIRLGKDPLDSYKAQNFEQSLGILATPPRQIVSLKQVLDWQSTPIKQISGLYLGGQALSQADRLWTAQLYIYPFHVKARGRANILDFSEPIQARLGGQPAGGAPAGIPGKPGGLPPAGGGTGPGGFDAGPGMGQPRAAEVSRNGIPLRRYFPANPADTRDLPNEVSEIRRLPIALVLVVEHPVMPDILVALANSPLRVQVTQAVYTRHPPLGPPPVLAVEKPGAAAGAGGAPAAASAASSETAETNLIELQIYGLASIYENPYMSSEWRSEGGGAIPGGGGPRFGPPPGGGKPPVFRGPGGDSRGFRGPAAPGRRGPRGRR